MVVFIAVFSLTWIKLTQMFQSNLDSFTFFSPLVYSGLLILQVGHHIEVGKQTVKIQEMQHVTARCARCCWLSLQRGQLWHRRCSTNFPRIWKLYPSQCALSHQPPAPPAIAPFASSFPLSASVSRFQFPESGNLQVNPAHSLFWLEFPEKSFTT